MNWTEIFATAISVAVGVLIANVIAKRVPALSSDWDSTSWDSTYDGSDEYYG